MKHITTTLGMRRTLALFLASSLLFSCGKDDGLLAPAPITKDPANQTTTPGSTVTYGSIQLMNNALTPVDIYINGVISNKALASKATTEITGNPGDVVQLQFNLYSKNENDEMIGRMVSLQEAMVFPQAGEMSMKPINVPDNYFLAVVSNQTESPLNQIIVNELTSDEFISDLTIMNDGKPVACGYYPSSSRSASIKVNRIKGGFLQWSFDELKLPGTENQVIAVICQ